MKNVLALIAVAGLATAASAQSKLDLVFSTDSGTTWFDNVNVTPGSTVWVGVIMSIPTQYYGISGARYNIVSNNGQWDIGGNDTTDFTPGKGSATDARLAGFDFGGQTQVAFEAAGSLRIDAKGDTGNNPNAGISTSQNTPGALGTNFNTNKSALVYRFAVNTHGGRPGAGEQLIFRIEDGTSGVNQITSFKGYETSGSTSGSDILGGVEGDTGTITFVPAPASLALVGLAGIAAGRRRR
ncbi:MAG: PEP-CTERM sorting domain-containing protein [Phycisphaerae bacterium]|nr:PEP-CTERM sorting domain-containing protein [Phycisphaerae bacterium]